MTLLERICNIFSEEPKAEVLDPLTARVILLLEAATYDHHYAPEEQGLIIHLLGEKYGLSKTEAERTLELANNGRAHFPDIQSFTRQLIPQLSHAEREELMMELWLVIFADKKIEKNEEMFARKMLTLLRLDRKQWIAAKLAARDYINDWYGDGSDAPLQTIL